jgi:hypothetical protein
VYDRAPPPLVTSDPSEILAPLWIGGLPEGSFPLDRFEAILNLAPWHECAVPAHVEYKAYPL